MKTKAWVLSRMLLLSLVLLLPPEIVFATGDSSSVTYHLDKVFDEDEEKINDLYALLAEAVYTKEELEILYRITEAEVTGGTIDSKVHVVHVIMNRVASDGFPNSIKAVVFQDGQFSPVYKDYRYYSITVTEETKIAVHKALCTKDTTNGALFFCDLSLISKKSTKRWFQSLTMTLDDTESSGHTFYTTTGR